MIVGEEIRTTEATSSGCTSSRPSRRADPAETAAASASRAAWSACPSFRPLPLERRSQLLEAELDELLALVDFVEVFNARLFVGAATTVPPSSPPTQAARRGRVGRAHVFEVGVAYTIRQRRRSSRPTTCARRCPAAALVTSRGSYYARAVTPVAKIVQRWRGNRAASGDGAPPANEHGPADDRAEPAADEQLIDYPGVHEASEPPPPLSQRLRDPRTIISIVLPIVLVVLIAVTFGNINFEALIERSRSANPWLLLAAFGVYYLGFPLRGYRWTLLLRGAGTEVRVRDSTEIIFISWLVNCLVPAKLGDVYRAYLLRLNYAVSLVAHVRHGLHRARLRPVRDRPARPRRRLLELPQRHVAGGPARLRHRPGRHRPLAIGLYTVRNFGSRIIRRCRCRIAWSSSTTASRRASSRSRRAAAGRWPC